MAVLRVKILLQSEGSDVSIKHAPEELNQPVMLKRDKDRQCIWLRAANGEVR